MIKIAITVRNRLEMLKKAIESLQRHSTIPHEIYIYDNLTNHRLKDHFDYYHELLEKKIIHQITFNTEVSTHHSFSKAAALNQFGHLINDDPKQNEISFLALIDSDIIVTMGWDKIVAKAWKFIKQQKMDHIRVVGQSPGGIKDKKPVKGEIAGHTAITGKFGGSGFWCVLPDFYKTVGFINLKELVNANKRHDQTYWRLMANLNKNKDYILGLQTKLCIHCGYMAGSVCNTLTDKKIKDPNEKTEKIKFEEADKLIGSMSFDEFYKHIFSDERLIKDW